MDVTLRSHLAKTLVLIDRIAAAVASGKVWSGPLERELLVELEQGEYTGFEFIESPDLAPGAVNVVRRTRSSRWSRQ